MKMMATGGKLLSYDTCHETSRTWKEAGVDVIKRFRYFFPYHWHFKYRHAVDDHNNLSHRLPSIEDTWKTIIWEHRVCSYILATTETNVFLMWRYFVKPSGSDNACDVTTILNLCRKLAWELTDNPFLTATQCEESNMAVNSQEHALRTAPPHAPAYSNRCWVLGNKGKYQSYKFRSCKRVRCRTYCTCIPGDWKCKICHLKHYMDVAREE